MTATAYYVLTTLGPHSKGDVITFSAEQLGAGIDIARLEALGALRLASGGEIAHAMPAQVQAANLFGVGNFTTDVAPTNGTSGTYATLAPYGAVLYDVSQSPPMEYINTGTQQSPTWTAAGGGTSLPGVTSIPVNGVKIGGALAVSQLGGVSPTADDPLNAIYMSSPLHTAHAYVQLIHYDPASLFQIGQITPPDTSVSLRGSGPGSPSFGDYYYAQEFSPGAGELAAIELSLRLDPAFPVADAGLLSIAVYVLADNAGLPGTFLGSNASNLSVSGLTADWQKVRFLLNTPFTVSGGSLWLAVQVSSNAPTAYAHAVQVQALNPSASPSADSIDGSTTWVAEGTAPQIAATFYGNFPIETTNPMQFDQGIGVFGHAPQTAPRTLAQSAITAMTDANAKTAVQAVANALADIGALTLT